MAKTIHFIISGKGGIGKTYVSSLLTQILKKRGEDVLCIDADPVNQTLLKMAALAAVHVNITPDGFTVDNGRYDEMVAMLIAHEGVCVIDNGASSYLPILNYIVENDLVSALGGAKVVFHVILVGGRDLDETLRSLKQLLSNLTSPIVVWENEYFGKVIKDGVRFAQSVMYQENKARFVGIVNIEQRDQDMFGANLRSMTENNLTFAQAIEAGSIMVKHRLGKVYDAVETQVLALAL